MQTTTTTAALYSVLMPTREEIEQRATDTLLRGIAAMKPGDTASIERHDPTARADGRVWTITIPKKETLT